MVSKINIKRLLSVIESSDKIFAAYRNVTFRLIISSLDLKVLDIYQCVETHQPKNFNLIFASLIMVLLFKRLKINDLAVEITYKTAPTI